MAITFQTDNIEFPNINKKELSRWIKVVAEKYGKFTGEIAFIFCNDEKILELNRQYLKHDYYTDIITFDYSEGDTISGDIFVSLDTVNSNSRMYNTDYKEELHRVIVHGILHLCGLDDSSETDKKSMRKAEENALKLLKN